MGLARVAARGAQTGSVDEARALGREAEVLLAEMQLAHIVVALTAILVRGGIARTPRGVVGRKREFCGDLLERVLRVRQAELVAEEIRLGGTAVGGGRRPSGYVERGFDELLRFLYQIRDVEHSCGTRPRMRRQRWAIRMIRQASAAASASWWSGVWGWEGVACVRLSHLLRRSGSGGGHLCSTGRKA